MKIIVVGAGIGGLSVALSLALAGHSVTILESAAALAEVGAGVQLTPNSTRYFWKWGLKSDILARAALPDSFNVHRGSDGYTLGRVPFQDFEKRYGAPYLVIHRADIHQILHEHAVKAGVDLRLGNRVVEYDFENAEVLLANGQKLHADLVIAVDGIKSQARKDFLKYTGDGLEKTGWAAYRAVAPVDKVRANDLAGHIVSEHTCNCWSGDNCSIMTYMVKGSEILNIVLSHPDNIDTDRWTPEQYKTEISRLSEDFDPSLAELLKMTNGNIQNWPIYQVRSLPKWTSASGRFVLLGDAAHAMAFYLSMGVSMAVEDAAAITECLSIQTQRNASLSTAMHVYQAVRKSRCDAVKGASLHAGNILHLPPGPDQISRDAAMRDDIPAPEINNEEQIYLHGTSYGIANSKIRDWCYGYDVLEATRAEWNQTLVNHRL